MKTHPMVPKTALFLRLSFVVYIKKIPKIIKQIPNIK
jgi:hypothetical protein